MSARSINFALLGAGQIGELHAETIARYLHDARLAAVVDPVAENARRAASYGEDVKVVGAAAEILSDAAIDAVVIASPTRFHASLMLEAATSGKHIFCEKPIALTLDDGRAAVEEAESRRLKLQVGFQRRFDAGYARAREVIAGGELGSVELLLSTTRDPNPPPPGYLEWCGGMFLDTAIHDFDSVRFLSGSEVVEVFATASALVTPNRHGTHDLDTSVTVLRLASGALATVTNSLRTGYGYEASAEVYGARGKLVIEARAGGGVQRFDAGGVSVAYPQTYRERFGQAYREELADFLRCIVEDDMPRATGHDGVRALEVALAATRSQQEGCTVRL